MITTDEEFARTLTKEQREYLQGLYEHQIEEAIERFERYQNRQTNIETLVQYYKRAYSAMLFRSLGGCEECKLSERARKYWISAHFEVIELDKR